MIQIECWYDFLFCWMQLWLGAALLVKKQNLLNSHLNMRQASTCEKCGSIVFLFPGSLVFNGYATLLKIFDF